MKAVEYLAFALIGAAILGLIGYFCWDFFTDSEIHLGLRVLAGIAAVGFVLLLGYVGVV